MLAGRTRVHYNGETEAVPEATKLGVGTVQVDCGSWNEYVNGVQVVRGTRGEKWVCAVRDVKRCVHGL
jgi:hypothetical protein